MIDLRNKLRTLNFIIQSKTHLRRKDWNFQSFFSLTFFCEHSVNIRRFLFCVVVVAAAKNKQINQAHWSVYHINDTAWIDSIHTFASFCIAFIVVDAVPQNFGLNK